MAVNMNGPLVICVAPVGMWGKGNNNPLSPEEVAEDTYRSYLNGASMVHLHVRDRQGTQTAELDVFRETIRLIRKQCDIIIQGSTGGMSSLDAEGRCVALNAAGVEVATLNMGSVNFFDGVYVNSFEDMTYWAKKMAKKNVLPELCIFEAGMIGNVERLRQNGSLKARGYYNFSLGFPGAMPATLKNLVLLMDSIPAGAPWLYVEHGMRDFAPVARAITLGGHVRVGFEDSLYLDETTKARNNAELVAKAARLAKEVGRAVATAAQARRILGVRKVTR